MEALLVVDVINTFEHEDAGRLLASFRERLEMMVAALDDSRASGRPIVYVNDANGKWDGNAPAHVEAALAAKGGDVVERLAPCADDLFLFKPRYSAFDQTPLALVLEEFEVGRVLIAGAATEGCVLQTGIAAREHRLEATVLANACATVEAELETVALEYARRVAGIRVVG
jgi:nicotinamidase-related amidase